MVFFEGNRPYGKDFIAKRSSIQIVFCLSNNNINIFKDEMGNTLEYPHYIIPNTFSIKSSEGDDEWSFYSER